MKKPLSKCQECQQALAASRELLTACHRERDRLHGELQEVRHELAEALVHGERAWLLNALAIRMMTLSLEVKALPI